MKNISVILLYISLAAFSCKTPLKSLFTQKTPYEAYAQKLGDRGLDKTPEGRAWLAASTTALEAPVPVDLPYRQQGFFQPGRPRALGLQFTAKAGEKLTFSLTQKEGRTLPLYADLFLQYQTATPLVSADTGSTAFSFIVAETGAYILRLQPGLFHSGSYALSISVGPSLGFPVLYSKASIGSVWGDNRDAGKRHHEGIDIFAPRLTPAVAAAGGYITGVREGGLGGKTVWLRPDGKDYTLYYAHLDEQRVQEGQRVKQGDVVGLVGNTGNAKYTPSHLHFGVYTASGAVDPLPFVNRREKTAPALADKTFTHYLKLTRVQKTPGGTVLKAATPLLPLAADASGYIAEAPDGRWLRVAYNAVKTTPAPVTMPDTLAAAGPVAATK